MSTTERSVVRNNAAARSKRRVRRYECGDSPKARRNSRLKWARESRAARAKSSTPSGSKYLASARSLARSRCRAGGTKAIPGQYGLRRSLLQRRSASHRPLQVGVDCTEKVLRRLEGLLRADEQREVLRHQAALDRLDAH